MEWTVREFRRILTDTNELHGWNIPNNIVEYEARILAERIDCPDWRPKDSYAETYLKITNSEAALAFGNVCWFTRSVFPELGNNRGITQDYWVKLGQSSYDRALRTVPSITVTQMRDNFEFLAETVLTAFRHYGSFRSMWD